MIKILSSMLLMSLFLFANIGTVMAVKGNALIKRVNKVLRIRNGIGILNGDRVITKTNSRVQIILKDDTTLTIGANSSFEFTNFYFDGTKKSSLRMRARRGFFRAVTGKISKIAPKRFKVKTVSATIGIRGTDFSGNIMKNREIIKCYSGAIIVKLDRGGSRNLLAGMLIDITNKGVKVKHNLNILPKKVINRNSKSLPFKKIIDSGNINNDIIPPKDIDSRYEHNNEQPYYDEPYYHNY